MSWLDSPPQLPTLTCMKPSAPEVRGCQIYSEQCASQGSGSAQGSQRSGPERPSSWRLQTRNETTAGPAGPPSEDAASQRGLQCEFVLPAARSEGLNITASDRGDLEKGKRATLRSPTCTLQSSGRTKDSLAAVGAKWGRAGRFAKKVIKEGSSGHDFHPLLHATEARF